MKINEKGVNLLHKYEGLKLEAYLCPAKVWTIGYGNTRYEDGTPVKQGDKITKERAVNLFNNIIKHFEEGVIKSIKVGLNHNQFSALVSFAYNVGLGNFKSSTLLKLVNKNPNDPLIRDQFLRWNKAGGKVLNGLINRRKEEAELYFNLD
ncbi:lysozyme [Belliella pelovolcani]|uniref:Lysozyme n=1 Tax=Belliella pelovolcani TaxID=529505 RepID=A0A1N7MRD4_9BACT|nr:lysozyme [Belliella pelovolcani]SIS88687.1 lysozyme [Belliella pelovolcani]